MSEEGKNEGVIEGDDAGSEPYRDLITFGMGSETKRLMVSII